ncbi:MAG TPA: translocation/assembly module TamB domain-containing protein, partial [Saprospiraceae bacterium]|nr:translocation/assembly module TamB domain-containing protein [Saprospiraceae bacterium]
HDLNGTLDLPELHYGGINVYGSNVVFGEHNGESDIDLEIVAADLRENFFFEDVLIQGKVTDDSLKFRFKTDDLADIIDQIDMDVLADPEKGTWNISLSPRKLKMLGTLWQIPEGNKIEIRKNYFSLDHFELVSGDQHIRLEDIDNKGLKADIAGFNISYLNELWVNDKFKFTGLYDLNMEIDNLYDIRHLKSVLHIPALKVNNVPYGEWVLNSSMDDPKDSVRIDLKMHHNETMLTGEGAYLPPIKSIPKDKQNYLRLALKTTDFPLDFLEFLLGGNIRDTEGSVDMNLNLTGKVNKLNPNGQGVVYNGSTIIDYLGASYSFHNQAFKITENMIDLTGAKLYDVQGNVATIQGGLTHRYLRNLGLNATITSEKIIGLDVTSEENNVFYGTGIGKVFARFSGTVSNPVMNIDATTAPGTHIYIPLTGAASRNEHDFAVFLQNGLLPADKPTQIKFGGISLNMTLTITEDAILEIIFDENTGEVLRGRGNGDIQMVMSRTGNFQMFGNFTISKGDYLFTNFRVVRKP